MKVTIFKIVLTNSNTYFYVDYENDIIVFKYHFFISYKCFKTPFLGLNYPKIMINYLK